jgi:hypothetical protein
MKRKTPSNDHTTRHPRKPVRQLDSKELATIAGGKGITLTDVIVSS